MPVPLVLVLLAAEPKSNPLSDCRRFDDRTLQCGPVAVFAFEGVAASPAAVEALLSKVSGGKAQPVRRKTAKAASEPVWSLAVSRGGWEGYRFEATVIRRTGSKATVFVCGAKDEAQARAPCEALRRAVSESGWRYSTVRLPVQIGERSVPVPPGCIASFETHDDGRHVEVKCATTGLTMAEKWGSRAELTAEWKALLSTVRGQMTTADLTGCRVFEDDETECALSESEEGFQILSAFSHSDDWSYGLAVMCAFERGPLRIPSVCQPLLSLAPTSDGGVQRRTDGGKP